MNRDWDEIGENALIGKLLAIGIVLAYHRMFSFIQIFSKRVTNSMILQHPSHTRKVA